MNCPWCNFRMIRQMPPNGGVPYRCDHCLYVKNQITVGEDIMAKQQKRAVRVSKIANPRYGYKGQWTVSASPTSKNPNPDPYTVSLANDGNWSCACMIWTRNHPREDCKHIMRIKLAEAVPAEVKIEPSMQFVQATGRKFR